MLCYYVHCLPCLFLVRSENGPSGIEALGLLYKSVTENEYGAVF